MIYELEFNKNDYEKIVKHKTRKTINLRVRNKSSKSYKQDRTRKSDCESINL